MRPINSRDRRLQFLRFTALFLLSTLPLLLLVHAHGRVDHAENQYLREQYKQKRQVERNEEAYVEKLNRLRRNFEELSRAVVDRSVEMQRFESNQSGVVFNRLEKIRDERNDFRDLVISAPQPADTVLIGIVDDGMTVVTEFKSIYSVAMKKVEELSTRNADLDRDLKNLTEEMRAYKRQYGL